jgi:hypothetical protein
MYHVMFVLRCSMKFTCCQWLPSHCPKDDALGVCAGVDWTLKAQENPGGCCVKIRHPPAMAGGWHIGCCLSWIGAPVDLVSVEEAAFCR